MSDKKIRLNTSLNGGNKHIQFKLDQDFESMDILSMNLKQEDIYRNFNSDYGCLIGRVIANGGVGIPNAKISVFIPIDDNESDLIKSIYPFTKVTDKDEEGRPYNLLPRVSQISPFANLNEIKTGFGYTPKVPLGSFPTKEEILLNDDLLYIHKKYYKYTTVTNDSGDYMLFGLPVGLQSIHLSVDITDIGKYSMTPALMIKKLGYSEDFFIDNGTLIKPTTDLNDAPNIIIQNLTVDIKSFWGDSENFEIGITRQDFNIKSVLIGSFVIFGNNITMPYDGAFGLSDQYGECRGDDTNVCSFSTVNKTNAEANNINTFRTITPNIEIYTISNTISDEQIINKNFQINSDIIKLDESEYVRYNKDGMFAIVIPCNRKKIITNIFGEEEIVDNDNPNGVYTEFNGYFMVDSDESDIRVGRTTDKLDRIRGGSLFKRAKFKIPQEIAALTKNNNNQNIEFIKKNHKFTYNKYYSISQFFPIAYRDGTNESSNNDITKNSKNTLGMIISNNAISDPEPNDPEKFDTTIEFPHVYNSGVERRWGSQWLNLTLFHIQYGGIDRKRDNRARVSGTLIADSRSADMFFLRPNSQNLGGGKFNSDGYINAECNYFRFIEVTKNDIISLFTLNKKIVRKTETMGNQQIILESDYTYTNHNQQIIIPSNTNELLSDNARNIIKGINFIDNEKGAFIFKGFGINDCINYLFTLNLI